MIVLIWLKDAALCLAICSTLANIKRNKQRGLLSLGMVILLFMMGLDFIK